MDACLRSLMVANFQHQSPPLENASRFFSFHADHTSTNWTTPGDGGVVVSMDSGDASPSTSDDSETAADAGFGSSVSAIIEHVIYSRLVGVVCLFGIFGNLLNLYVLTRKSLTYTMERMEKSAHYGLVGLAVSDTLVCLAVLPSSIYGTDSFGDGRYTFRLLYTVYGQAVISSFVLSSTWLTVTMATGRYLAVCHPLHARQFIGKRFALWSLAVVFVVCTSFNVPRFFRTQILVYPCDEMQPPSPPDPTEPPLVEFLPSTTHSPPSPLPPPPPPVFAQTEIYYPVPGLLKQSIEVEQAYEWTYFVLGVALPLTILVYCNAHLSLALRRSLRMRHRNISTVSTASSSSLTPSAAAQAASRRSERAASRITATLVAIVVSYVALFVPAELVNFFASFVTSEHTAVFNVTVAVLNLLQTVNFAFNFVLYCIVNAHFRRTVCRLVGCGGSAGTVNGGGFCQSCCCCCWRSNCCPKSCRDNDQFTTAKSTTRFGIVENHRLVRSQLPVCITTPTRCSGKPAGGRVDGCSGSGGGGGSGATRAGSGGGVVGGGGGSGGGRQRHYGSLAAGSSFV